MQEIQTFPTLYNKASNGTTRVWLARILAATATYETEHGTLNGKMQLTQRAFTEGKNIGKKNETTPLQQCTAEITKKWADKKAKEGYTETLPASAATAGDDEPASAAATTIYPMLAQTYDPATNAGKKTGIKFPCYVQPKLDGLRCVMYWSAAEGQVVAQSRTGGRFTTVGHITDVLCGCLRTSGLILDGELYSSEMPFETLVGHIKRKKVDPSMQLEINKIEYHVYDLVDNMTMTFPERHELLLRKVTPLWVRYVATELVYSDADVKTKFAEYIAAGYEGIMLRNAAGLYRPKVRSSDLQKYKEFQEAEYPIVGFTQGEGRDAGTVIWVCVTPESREFTVRPRGTVEHRKQLFVDGASFVGKQLTVIFQELSEQHVPRFPVGKSIRDGF